MNPFVSIVITTKNEEKNIKNCLESILKQTYPRDKIEIIIVDNNSTDRTKEIASVITSEAKQSIRFFNRGPERSAQRNFGMIQKAQGEYVMFIDADFILEKDLIEECVKNVKKDNGLIGLYIPLRWVGNNWIIKARGFEREFYDGTVLDAARFIKKDIFIKESGFDERLFAGEDWDLDKRIKKYGKIGLIKSKFLHHEDESINLKDFLRKIRYYSGNLSIYINKWGKNDKDIKKQFGILYRYFIVFFENGKWQKLISHPILTFKMYWLKLLIGVSFLINKK